MAELADALDSGSSTRKGVEVQILSSALHSPWTFLMVLDSKIQSQEKGFEWRRVLRKHDQVGAFSAPDGRPAAKRRAPNPLFGILYALHKSVKQRTPTQEWLHDGLGGCLQNNLTATERLKLCKVFSNNPSDFIEWAFQEQLFPRPEFLLNHSVVNADDGLLPSNSN